MNEDTLAIALKVLAILRRELLYRETEVILRENTLMNSVYTKHGWGNGYVALPKGHPLYEKEYNEIEEECDIYIHGGLTYSAMEGDKWVVGFDTSHYMDTMTRWPESAVRKEAESLKEQLTYIEYQLPF